MKTVKLFGTDVKLSTILQYVGIYVAFVVALLLLDTIPQSFLYDKVSWYGVLVGTGFLAGLIVTVLQSHRRNIDPDFFFTLLLYVFPFAIIGARLYYVVFEWEQFHSFYDIIAIWNGGLAIYGGIIGGAIAVILACKIHKQSIIDTIDVIVPALILGQAIGRWGNFVNQEAYGVALHNTDWQWFPFAVDIEYCTQIAEGCTCGGYGWHLATFFYESMWNLIGFFVLSYLLKKVSIKGVLMGSYFIYYGVGRFVIEGLRMDSLYWGIFRVSQVLSFVLIFVGVVMIVTLLILDRRKNEKNHIVSTT